MNLKSKIVALGLVGAVGLAKLFEGLVLPMYYDPIGIPTDCWGHTGADVRKMNTVAECEDKLYKDLLVANATVDSCTTVPLNSNQRSAFVSFAFNTGPGRKGVKDGYCVLKNGNKPSFLRKLNAGDYTGACNGLMDWTSAGGKQFKGLVNRRTAERALCLKEVN